MSDSALFSVVIATCNRPELALRAVKSVLLQSSTSKEVIVVNNGSSAELISEYQQLFSEIKSQITYLDLNNSLEVGLGPSTARNVGISVAKGKYVAFCDDDDEWTDINYLSRATEILKKQKVDILFGDQSAVSSDGEQVRDSWFKRDLLIPSARQVSDKAYSVDVNYFYRNGGFPHLNSTIYSLAFLNQSGGFASSLSYEEDFELFHRLAAKTKNIIYLDTVVSRHNIPDKSKDVNITTKMSEYHKKLSRILIFNKLIIENNNKSLRNFAGKQVSYTYKDLADLAMKNRDYKFASKMAKAALGWNFTIKYFMYFMYIVAASIFVIRDKDIGEG
ncbi:glycosyltransferase [Vibrio hannami]|uniref:glycosyltransferase family 2 protein n=1 Tax=Vibrio hannami TaxID=2717094 RepID=UPI00240EFBFB|nr:glycosyltransferase [Vibrio hannami]MDG3088284.1 glycosyltransferase [Vibrio hannami]